MRRYGLVLFVTSLALTGCDSCRSGGSSTDGGKASGRAKPAACNAAVVAELPVSSVRALTVSPTTLYAVSKADGQIFAIPRGDGGAPKQITSGEKSPFALVAREGKILWASADGIFGADADGANRTHLFGSYTVRALAVGPFAAYFADGDSKKIWVLDWPKNKVSAELVKDVSVTEDGLAASRGVIAWVGEDGKAWAYQVDSGARRQLASNLQQAHDLTLGTDGKTMLWHESRDAGSVPRAFAADITATTGEADIVPGDFGAAQSYVRQGSCVYGPATFKRVDEKDWVSLGPGRDGPVAEDGARWYWVDASGGKVRVMAANVADCCL